MCSRSYPSGACEDGDLDRLRMVRLPDRRQPLAERHLVESPVRTVEVLDHSRELGRGRSPTAAMSRRDGARIRPPTASELAHSLSPRGLSSGSAGRRVLSITPRPVWAGPEPGPHRSGQPKDMPSNGSGPPVHGSRPCSMRRRSSASLRKRAEPAPQKDSSPSGQSSNSARMTRTRNSTTPQS